MAANERNKDRKKEKGLEEKWIIQSRTRIGAFKIGNAFGQIFTILSFEMLSTKSTNASTPKDFDLNKMQNTALN